METTDATGIEADTVDDNIFQWNVRVKNFTQNWSVFKLIFLTLMQYITRQSELKCKAKKPYIHPSAPGDAYMLMNHTTIEARKCLLFV
jgi:hypothetical protein